MTMPVNECVHHKGKVQVMICETCDDTPHVCVMCISTSHSGHVFVDMESEHEDSIPKLLKEATNLTELNKEKLLSVSKAKDESKKATLESVQQIKDLGEHIKSLVDHTVSGHTQQCEDTDERNTTKLDFTEEQILTNQRNLQEVLQSSRNYKTAPGNIREALVKNLKVCINRGNSTTPHLTMLKLSDSARDLIQENVCAMFSSIRTADWQPESLKKSVLGKPFAQILTRSKIISTFNHYLDRKFESVYPGFDGFAWLVCTGSNEARLVNLAGDCDIRLRFIRLKRYVYINDIMCTSDKTKTLFCCSDNTIRRYRHIDDDIDVMFRTKYYSSSLCEHISVGNILVSHPNKRVVMLYNQMGTVLRTIAHDNNGKQLFLSPGVVCVNKKTGDIAIIECCPPIQIVIVDAQYNVICRYTGFQGKSLKSSVTISKGNQKSTDSDTTTQTRSPVNHTLKDVDEKDTSPFAPTDVCFDGNGNLVVSDAASRSVIIVDRLGTTTSILSKTDHVPARLGLQPNGHLWVGYEDGCVRIIKYLPKI